MRDEKLKFVIVGHIDHGKSTLIGRILYDTNSFPDEKIEEIKNICNSLGKPFEFSYFMDNLEEERNQGITIDTTQTFFNTEKRKYVIIDAPGHAEFIKNMISGASQADVAVLIIDAEEGIKEQTKRHAYLLSLLQISKIIIVINKMDLVDYNQNRFEEIKQDIEKFLLNLKIKPSFVIPISARKGDFVVNKTENMKSWYNGPTLLESLEKIDIGKENCKQLRFVVQDIYNFEKRIIVGRVESGILRKGYKIKILPSEQEGIIKSIEEYLKDNVTDAETGKSIGITIEDKLFIDRGNVIVSAKDPDNLKTTNEIKTNIFWMDDTPYRKGENLYFRCATQEVNCEIEKIERIINSSTLELLKITDQIKTREVAMVTIKTEKPVIVENFNKTKELGRFVLARYDTCACGVIL